MKIKKIEIKNFKFHHNLSFEISNNCLVYGENGTGKSSIYEALYSIFYNKKRINKTLDIREKYKNRNHKDKDLEVIIKFDNENELIRKDNELISEEFLDNTNIFMANERVLTGLIHDNFYIVLKEQLIEHFPNIKSLFVFEKITRLIDRKELNKNEINKEINILNDKFKTLFHETIPVNEINKIIKEHFKEYFEIHFDIEEAWMDEFKFHHPIIKIKIDDINHEYDLHNHFNEAKLKLISIAIYLAVIKKHEIKTSQSNLLILDDFLTSLDMANRKLIIQYILENFNFYQKIILTHNIQFFNLIQKLLKNRDELSQWDIKNIFFRIISNDIETIIYTKETDYIKLSEQYIEDNKLNEAGNTIRKEFERIIEELRQINEVGAKEKLSNIVEELLKIDDSKDVNRKKLKQILKKAKFYQQIVMNSASHDDSESEFYEKECKGAITVLKELNKHINAIKKEN